ncbi:hypothetical protein KDK_57640 [Dictyobacter kobayashii]|uniref:NAD-dependent epimerase/dehydratase domain-containing protein n=1 Tax=Dictyobacter kobayashii TaxID=2014872 RepID=A0A402AS85_9CHLR|nr:hypothetical protein KDK_57640 [Dictyobacter kobayashii]
MIMKTILVTGATGKVGSHFVPVCCNANIPCVFSFAERSRLRLSASWELR